MGLKDRLKSAVIIDSTVEATHASAEIEKKTLDSDLKGPDPIELRTNANNTTSEVGYSQGGESLAVTNTPKVSAEQEKINEAKHLINTLNEIPNKYPEHLDEYMIPKEKIVKHISRGGKSRHTVTKVSYKTLENPLTLAKEADTEGIMKLIAERKNGKAIFKHKDKKYTTCLPLSREDQIKTFGNTNDEIITLIDPKTKGYLKSLAHGVVKDNSGKLTYQETLDKMYQLQRICGNPKIRTHQDETGMVGAIIKSIKGKPNPHFDPFSGTIYINDKNDIESYYAEMSHAFRDHNNTMGEGFHFVADGIKDIVTFNSMGFTQRAQQNNYRDKGKMEYDAHKNVEPGIKSFFSSEAFTPLMLISSVDMVRKFNNNSTVSSLVDLDNITRLAKKLDHENLLSPHEQSLVTPISTKEQGLFAFKAKGTMGEDR